MAPVSSDERVEMALLVQMQRLLRRITRTAPAGVAAFLLAAWREVDHRWLLAYGGWALTMCIVTDRQIAYETRARAAGRSRFRTAVRLLGLNMAVSAVGWGTVTWMVGGRAPWVQAAASVYVVGYIAANMVFNAPTRWLFHVFQVPLVVSAVTGLLITGGALGHLMAAVITVFALNAASLHAELHKVYAEAVGREVGNADLVEQLREQQQATESLNARLAHDATHDVLTGLANRLLFQEHLEHALAQARRQGALVHVLYLDLDRFKVINDSLGHGAGDQLLAQFANRVRPLLRAADVFARLGGDEFTVLLADADDGVEALHVARRIQQACATPFWISGRQVVTSVSIGVAQNADLGDSADDLLRQADVALYRAKERGRNRVESFDDSLRALLDRKLDDELAVRAAVAAGEIVAWFQPEVELATGRIVGVEALARWIHPVEGVLLPGRFLPVIEECGLEGVLLRTMVRQSGQMVLELEQAGLLDPDFRVWVNMNPDDGSARNTDELRVFTERLGLSPSRFGVEVTERALMRDLSGAQHHLEALKEMGVAVALDDFGTGHSSLALLQTLQVDVVKIDRSFVRDVTDDERDRALVLAIVRLTRDLGLATVAEGVETEAQEQFLAEAGCRVGQGFRYSPAVPAEVLGAMLRDGVPWPVSGTSLAATHPPR